MYKWTNSNNVLSCTNCNLKFDLFNRKHHCRICGNIYCSVCCQYDSVETKYLIPVKNNIISSVKELFSGGKKLICLQCKKKIDNEPMYTIFKHIFSFLEISEWYNVSNVSIIWNKSAMYHINSFTSIIKKSPFQMYTCREIEILSDYHFLYHNFFNIHKCKSILQSYYDTDDNQLIFNYLQQLELITVSDNILEKKFSHCKIFKCSKSCRIKLEFSDFLEILQFIAILENKKEKIWSSEKSMIKYFLNNFLKYINLPTNNNTNLTTPIFISILASISNTLDEIDNLFLFEIFNKIFNNMCKISYLCDEMKVLKSKKNHGIEMTMGELKILEVLIKYLENIDLFELNKMNFELSNYINIPNYNVNLPIMYPLDYSYNIINLNGKITLNSSTKPVLVTALISNNIKSQYVQFILKKDDKIITEFIASKLVKYIYNNLHTTFTIPSYDIKLISHNIGFIQFLDNSVTLRYIHENNITLQNHILEHNLTNTLENVRSNFSHSLALSSCISYVMCLGDRHLDNIMISNDGKIFHIDYGYIVSHPLYSILPTTNIKITNDMIDVLGGKNSIYYKKFIQNITIYYNNIMEMKNILKIYYKAIFKNDLNWEKKVDDRILSTITEKNIKTILANEIETSTQSYSNSISDLYYFYKKKLF